MPDLELRSVPATDSLSFGHVIDQAFGNPATDEEAETTASECYDPDWAIGVYDAGRLVATTSADIFELTLPAGPGQALPLATVGGVTAVTVLPSHRRRGLLNQMMRHQLEQFRERGLPLAVLTASESVIYGRYGYGLASSSQSLAIATKRSGFLPTDDARRSRRGRCAWWTPWRPPRCCPWSMTVPDG